MVRNRKSILAPWLKQRNPLKVCADLVEPDASKGTFLPVFEGLILFDDLNNSKCNHVNMWCVTFLTQASWRN